MTARFWNTLFLLLATLRERLLSKRSRDSDASDAVTVEVPSTEDATRDVLLVTPWNRQGGLGTYSSYLVDELADRCAVRVFPWDAELIVVRGFGLPLLNRELVDRVRRADVVHVQYTFGRYLFSAPLLLCLCKLVGTRTVVTQHERFDNLPAPRLLSVYHQLLYFLVDVLIVHTEARKSLVWRLHHRRTVVVPHGVISREVNRSPTSDPTTVLLPGLVRPIKGHDVAIRALAHLDDYRIRILGGVDDDEYLAELRELAADLGVNDRVEWRTSFVPEHEMFEELATAPLVVLPYEPHTSMSGILSHCISWRVPTLLTDCPSFQSVVECDDAFLSGREPSAVARSIRTIATSRSKQAAIIDEFGELSDRYSWASVAALTCEQY